METEKIIKSLGKTSRIFQGFLDEEIVEVLRRCARKSVKDKEAIFKEGTKGDSLYVIVSGSVVVKKEGMIIDVIRAGECFGEMGAFTDEVRSASTEADGDIILLAMEADKILAMRSEVLVKLLRNIILVLSERLRERIEEKVH